MNRPIIILCLLFAVLASSLDAQQKRPGRGYTDSRWELGSADSTVVVDVIPIYVFRRPVDMQEHWLLIYNLKKVYPIATFVKRRLAQAETDLSALDGDPKAQKKYIKELEEQLISEYTPIFNEMTRSQGKILIKLVDRETQRTTFDIVKEFKGGFSAFMWQGVARIFGANLKDTFDVQGSDEMLEHIILLYEAGLI